MKKETKEALKTYIPLMLFTTLLLISKAFEDPYTIGVLHGLAVGLLAYATVRIVSFYRAAFKARPPYSKLKQQRNGNNQTL